MQEETKDHKIHGNKSVGIKKDIKEDDNKNESGNRENKKIAIKRFYTIDGVKYTKEKVQVKVEKAQSLDEESYKGIILNVKK